MSPADVDALVELFQGLDEDDVYRRFFQGHMPPVSTIANMANVDERGGFRLIAEVGRTDGEQRLVGECGYELLPDGDAELAITVSREARGWLGPYLLDALLEAAAGNGIANLEADLLLDNRRMLALVRARGYATMDHSFYPAIVRAIIGTTRRVPDWPSEDHRPRVLVEVCGARWHAEAAAREAGLQVLVCPGPSASWSRCPAIRGRPCPLAAGADLIVDAVPPDSEQGRTLLEAHELLHTGVPLCVEFPRRERDFEDTDRPRIDADMDDKAVVHLLQKMVSLRASAEKSSEAR